MKKASRLICTALMLPLLLSFSVLGYSGEPIEDVRGAILYEATTGTLLFEMEADSLLVPASMTKIMTAILVLEKNPTLEGELTVAEQALDPDICWYMEREHLYAGEVLSVYDCMKYMLIPSGNEAATALACYVAGTVEDFVAMMNQKAAELGCTSTRYSDPIGLASHFTTPRDTLTICQYAMTFDKFREIVKLTSGSVPETNMRNTPLSYSTTNLIRYTTRGYYYIREWREDIIGIKTGFTNAAGRCFAGCMAFEGLEFYSVCMFGTEVTLGDNRVYLTSFLDTLKLYEWARTLNQAVFTSGETLGQVPVSGGMTPAVDIVISEDAHLLLDGTTKEDALASLVLPEQVKAPVKAGDTLATLTLTDAGGVEHVFSLVAAAQVNSILPIILAAGAAVLAVAALIVILLILRRRRMASR